MLYSEFIQTTLKNEYDLNSIIPFVIIMSLFMLIISVIAIYFIFHSKQKDSRIISVIIAAITLFCAIGGSWSVVDKVIEKNEFIKDLEEQETIVINGIVEDVQIYRRFHVKIKINDVYYKVLSASSDFYGSIIEGREYKLWILKNSGQVCKYQLQNDIMFSEDEKIKATDYIYFCEEYPGNDISNYLNYDAILRDYIDQYYLVLDHYNPDRNILEKYNSESWIFYSYFREDLNAYAGYSQSVENNEKYIYLLIDADNGAPIYFCENWY